MSDYGEKEVGKGKEGREVEINGGREEGGESRASQANIKSGDILNEGNQ